MFKFEKRVNMKILSKILIFFLLPIYLNAYEAPSIASDDSEISESDKEIAKKIIEHVRKDSTRWDRLAYFCDTFGPRLSGSQNLESALEWIQFQMLEDGLDNVKSEEVMVPHWVRNDEHLKLIKPYEGELSMLGLGMSIPTPDDGINAEVLVVKDLDELHKRKAEAEGRIVLFDVDWQGYGKTVQYRVYGADWAAQYGAIGSLMRSASPIGYQNPHTGVMFYSDSIKKIPHAALSHEASDILGRIAKRGEYPVVNFYMGCETFPDALSHNVMSEIRGSKKPDEILAIGGHIDSWDVGQGAHDDAGGSLATWEAVKLLKDLGIVPDRTIRTVMWTNEENGAMGGKTYAKMHQDEPHHLMFEFDSGVFPPNRIGFTGPDSLFKKFEKIEPLLRLINPELKITKGGGGVDIGPMMRLGIPGMSLGTNSDGKLFWYHHAPMDTVDHVDPKDYNDCIAAIAIAVYFYAGL
jgi:carboxypeptidase Q